MNINFLSYYIIPLVMAIISCAILFSRRDLFSFFVEGAREGLDGSLRLLPTLVGLVVSVSMFSASGLADALASLLSPLCEKIGIPSEIIPLLAVRPISGSASTAAAGELFAKYGADSFAARCAAVIMGSSDTMVYIITVYLSSVGIKRSRHAFISAGTVMVFCIVFSCIVTRLWFEY